MSDDEANRRWREIDRELESLKAIRLEIGERYGVDSEEL